MTQFKRELYDQFEMSMLSRGKVSLHMKVECIQIKEGILMTQKAYTQNILLTFGMKNCELAITIIDEKLKLKADMSKKEVDSIQYCNIVGKCLCLIHNQPDIQFAIGIISRFMARPQKSHLLISKRILCYIKYTQDYGILYRNNNQSYLS